MHNIQNWSDDTSLSEETFIGECEMISMMFSSVVSSEVLG